MKYKICLKNNKGVALVSVMIAIAFISIVATSMLMISVTNYNMKSSNVLSKKNYYETESNLVEVSTKLRNEIVNPTDSSKDPKAVIEEFMEKDSSNNPKEDSYDVLSIGKLIYPSGTGNASYMEYSDPVDDYKIVFESVDHVFEHTSENGIDTYKFKDLTIKRDWVSSDNSNANCSNSLKTDIVFKVYASQSSKEASGGVGELSMLLDNSADLTSSSLGCSVDLYGNNFIAKYNGIGSISNSDGTTTSYTKAGTAITMSNYAKMNIIGDYNIIYGDIVLNDNSCLVVYGNLTVFGDIYVNGNASLICVDKINMFFDGDFDEAENKYVNVSYLPWKTSTTRIYTNSNGAVYLGSSKISSYNTTIALGPNNDYGCINYSIDKSKYEEFASIVKVNDSSSDNDGLLKQILKKYHFNSIGDKYITELDPQSVGTISHGNYYGKDLKFYLQWQDPINGEVNNGLVINYANNCRFQQNDPRCTIISAKPFSFNMPHRICLTKVGDEEFKYMTKTDSKYVGVGDSFIGTYKDNHDNNNNAGYQVSPGDFFQPDCNQTVEKMFKAVTEGQAENKVYQTSLKFDSFVKDID